MPVIRAFRPSDSEGWLRCRLNAFFDSAYYDDVTREKPVYDNPSLELVAMENERIVGLLDVEKELEPGSLCSERSGTRAMIWSIAVLPDFRRRNLATDLLAHAISWAREHDVTFLEAWTRDDPWVQAWYESRGFQRFMGYWHVFLDQGQSREWVSPKHEALRPNSVFAHVVGGPLEDLPFRPSRAHECVGYELDTRKHT